MAPGAIVKEAKDCSLMTWMKDVLIGGMPNAKAGLPRPQQQDFGAGMRWQKPVFGLLIPLHILKAATV